MDIIRTTINHLQQFMPYQKMDIASLTFLAEHIEVNYFAQGEVVLNHTTTEPEYFFIVKQGVVEGHREARENQFYKNAFEFEEGEGFPVGPLLSHSPNLSQFIASTDCFVYQISNHVFHELRQRSQVFKDFCETRVAILLEESKRIIQSQYATRDQEQQPLSLPLGELIRKNIYSCTPDTPIRDILNTMDSTGIGSMVVVNPQQQPVGIFTLHDVLRRITIPQVNLDTPIKDYMTANPITLSRDDLAYKAALIMAKHGFRHILVVHPHTQVLLGVVSERDLFSLQRIGLRELSIQIQEATQLETLKDCQKEIKRLTKNMMAQGVAIGQLTHIISTLNDLISEKVISLGIAQFPEVRDIRFAWMAMGSEGRLEQMFYTDQDNGIIFEDTDNREEHRAILLKFAHQVNHDLNTLGFTLCKGNIMAMNPQWCLSTVEWRQRFSKWMNTPEPQAILNSTIFFDFRGIAGDIRLAEELRTWLCEQVSTQKMFLRFLCQNALSNRPPLGLIKDFTTNHNDAIDLKINGAALLVDIARLLALAHGSTATNTVQRFKDVVDKSGFTEKQIKGCIETFLFIQLLRMRHHFELEQAGTELSNEIKPSELNTLNTRVLKEAFRFIRDLQSSMANRYRL
ncbi:DUF294 nucleotidyltransferase-like domain-containing protein [Pelistega europaea]|uniref:CBS domain-containing protein n=1 Tax=Pelistega europaea TaxID=106147 RepID=A0A7Y4LAZ3_9BURK|nr:DUF294 nucleotidyltransferase-like domain-containing protein [Pelistega europaea]NOL50199.1 CBS domain-containing protein [Pelistega europaea]